MLTFVNFCVSLEMIAKKESTVKEWCEFENAITNDYAHNEVKALNILNAK